MSSEAKALKCEAIINGGAHKLLADNVSVVAETALSRLISFRGST